MENNYRVSWRHDTYSPITREVLNTPQRNQTTCYIKNNDGVVLYEGTVKQYFKDTPNRKIAMKESFKKAVNNIPSRITRRELWGQFKTISPKCLSC